jgi:KEOPS complex subunit Cgi121
VKEIDTLGKTHKIMIQLINADLIFSKLHVISAVEHALRSFDHKDNATSSLNLELLLYLAGERQIHKAIKKVGITTHTTNFVIIIVSDIHNSNKYDGKLSNTISDSVLETTQLKQINVDISGDRSTLSRFGISDEDIDTIKPDQYEGLILEKIALVDIIK